MKKFTIFFLVIFSVILLSCKRNNKLRNGVSLQEALSPFGSDGLEGHLYQGGFEEFYMKLQENIKKMKNNKNQVLQTDLSFWGSSVVLYDNNDAMFFLKISDNPRLLELNIHYFPEKKDLKNTIRVALINEAINMVFFDGSSFSIEKHAREEMLSDLAMSLCPDSCSNAWFQIVAGRLMPVVELPDFKEADDEFVVNELGIQPSGYIKLIRVYASQLIISSNQTPDYLVETEGRAIAEAGKVCGNDEQCFHTSMILFWRLFLREEGIKNFKTLCQKRYKEELEDYWGL